MLKKITVLMLLVAFAMQILQKAVIILDYYTHTSVYARDCENKARPMLHCNGKCQMMKKLKAEEKKEQEKLESSDLVFVAQSYFATLPAVPFAYTSIQYWLYNTGHPVHRSQALLRPPALA